MKLLGRSVGLDQPLFLIAGPCVVESEALQLRTAERLKDISDRLGVHFIFKSSFDKANRSSDKSYRGPGMDEGLRRPNAEEERINVPANPRNYWRYRMHLTLEQLGRLSRFAEDLKAMLVQAGR